MSAAAVPMVRGSLCVPPAPGSNPRFTSGQSQQVVAVFSNAKIASQCELESAGQGRAGYGGDHRLRHAFTQRHRLVEESSVVGRVLGPLAAGRPEGLSDLDKGRDIEVTIEITWRAAGDDDHANGGIAAKSSKASVRTSPISASK